MILPPEFFWQWWFFFVGKISRKNHLCSKSTFSKPVQAFLSEPKLGQASQKLKTETFYI